MADIHFSWFDHWLKGVANEAMNEAPARLFETGSNRWREAEQWPLSTGERSYFLRWDGSTGGLAPEAADDQDPDRSYRYDPRDPAPTRLNVRLYPIEDVPIEMNEVEARPDVLSYTSEPLTETVVVSGWPHLELWASSDRDDTDWHVKLTDVDEDGRSVKVCQ